jgi:hypothetical protein
MDKRGPFRDVARSDKAGTHGSTRWVVELSCGHLLTLKRKPPRERVCCAECLPVAVEDEVLNMDDIVTALTLADRWGLDNDQVEVVDGAARVTIDPFQLRRLLAA